MNFQRNWSILKEVPFTQFFLTLFPLSNLTFLTNFSSISTIFPIPQNDWFKLVIFIAHISGQYSYHWTTGASVTSERVTANVTGAFIIQFTTIIITCLSVSRGRVVKFPVLGDIFLQHECIYTITSW